MTNEIPRTPDDAMIKSWIASLELLALATEAAIGYSNYLSALDGEPVGNEPTPDEIYMGKIRAAKAALKALCHE